MAIGTRIKYRKFNSAVAPASGDLPSDLIVQNDDNRADAQQLFKVVGGVYVPVDLTATPSLGYLIYRAVIELTAGDITSVAILVNTLGEVPVWTHPGAATLQVDTIASLFSNLTFFNISNFFSSGLIMVTPNRPINPTQIQFYYDNGSGSFTDKSGTFNIEIIVYP